MVLHARIFGRAGTTELEMSFVPRRGHLWTFAYFPHGSDAARGDELTHVQSSVHIRALKDHARDMSEGEKRTKRRNGGLGG